MFSPTLPHLVLLWFVFGALSCAALLSISWEEWRHARSQGHPDEWRVWIRSIPADSKRRASPLWAAFLGFLSGPIALATIAISIGQALWAAREELAS